MGEQVNYFPSSFKKLILKSKTGNTRKKLLSKHIVFKLII